MSLGKLLNFKGINFWILASCIGLNFIWIVLTLGLTIPLLSRSELANLVQAGIIACSFIGPFLIGWLGGRMAADGRGPTYGAVGSLGAILPVVFVLIPSGIFGFMVLMVLFLGGVNGGLLSLSSRKNL